MSLQERITTDMKAALRAGEKDKLTLLRMLIADLKNFAEAGGHSELKEAREIDVLRKAHKMRLDSVASAKEAGRDEMAAKESQEAAWISGYLPQLMDESETREKVAALVAELGISDRKETGRFMKEWMARYKASSDGRIVQKALGEVLS